ncbi:transposase [Burkholderia contaminans]|uniref:transposase n=1 Tax=Burkholderia contaminans TaxID=488447 RepID=UPI00158F10D5|nr:transposase [Burkholderia contaminans]
MKQAILAKLQQAAREGAIRLIYLDEDGFCGLPPVQRIWSPRSLPREIEPNTHRRRSVLDALDYGANKLIHTTHARSIKGPNILPFIDDLLAAHDRSSTVIVLDNASIHHGVDEATRDRWLIDHKVVLFYLPVYSPELNKIEIVWRQLKFRLRGFVTWTKETIDAELVDLLAGYGTKFQSVWSLG